MHAKLWLQVKHLAADALGNMEATCSGCYLQALAAVNVRKGLMRGHGSYLLRPIGDMGGTEGGNREVAIVHSNPAQAQKKAWGPCTCKLMILPNM